MGNKRHKPEENVTKLRQVEVLCGQGMLRVYAIRQVQITETDLLSMAQAVWRYGSRPTDGTRTLLEGE